MTSVADRLTDLFGSVTAERASYKVYARAKYFPDRVLVYIPNKPYSRLLPGMELTEHNRTKNGLSGNSEDNLERSLRRTKSTIMDYVMYNQFDLFATFTFNKDRQDIDKCRSKMSDWNKNQQTRVGKFDYLLVPELHKDGALHFHGLLKGYPGLLTDSGVITKRKQTIYNFHGYRNGFTTAVKIPAQDIQRVGFYVRKYITKDMPVFRGKNRYWASKGLKLPVIEDNPKGWYLNKKPTREFTNEYGRFLEFSHEVVDD